MASQGDVKLPSYNAVKPLTEMFTVVIGLALTIALQSAIDSTQPFPIKAAILPALLSFLVTVLPFAHGAVTHLNNTYGHVERSSHNSGSLLLEYFILFLNGCLFICWASLLPKVEFATYTYMTILAIDAVWGLIARLFAPSAHSGRSATPSTTWAVLNVITFVILFLLSFFFIGPIYTPGWNSRVSWLIFIIALVRTGVDYGLTWKFYTGTIDTEESVVSEIS